MLYVSTSWNVNSMPGAYCRESAYTVITKNVKRKEGELKVTVDNLILTDCNCCNYVDSNDNSETIYSCNNIIISL